MDPARVAFDFLRRCETEEDTAQVVDAFRVAIALFGFTSSAGGGWIGEGQGRLQRFYFNDWPAEWLEIHRRTADFNHDPIVIEAARVMNPFTWTQIRAHMRPTSRGRALMEACDAFGWREIFAVPIHGPAGYVGLVALASMTTLALGARERAALEMMALAVHRRSHETRGFGVGPTVTKITERQRECLRWVAAGRQDGEIAELLGVSVATVHYHVEAAKKRLDARSRSQAVARLVLSGQL
jgi:LuxR family quorum sensing-dependent transcriptional regulator